MEKPLYSDALGIPTGRGRGRGWLFEKEPLREVTLGIDSKLPTVVGLIVGRSEPESFGADQIEG